MLDTNIQTPQWLSEMESILEELNEGIAIADDQLRVIFINEALARLGQYNRAELQGRTPDAIFPAEDLPVVMQQHESDLRYGHHRYEFYFPRKDGQKIPVIFSGRVIEGPDGHRYHLVVVTDITSQKCVEQQLRETNVLLEDRQPQIEADLALASRVQQSLAPRSLNWNDLAVEAYYSPARTIGGDFGVVLPHSHNMLSIMVCDVTGNGIGPALLANRIYSEILHELERASGPASLLRHIHEFVYTQIATDGFYLTMATGRFSQRGRRLTFASGGQPPAMLVSKRGLRFLESQNGILGCLAEIAPSESADEVDLDSGDRLVLYTDGLVELFNASDEMLGVEGLPEHDSTDSHVRTSRPGTAASNQGAATERGHRGRMCRSLKDRLQVGGVRKHVRIKRFRTVVPCEIVDGSQHFAEIRSRSVKKCTAFRSVAQLGTLTTLPRVHHCSMKTVRIEPPGVKALPRFLTQRADLFSVRSVQEVCNEG